MASNFTASTGRVSSITISSLGTFTPAILNSSTSTLQFFNSSTNTTAFSPTASNTTSLPLQAVWTIPLTTRVLLMVIYALIFLELVEHFKDAN